MRKLFMLAFLAVSVPAGTASASVGPSDEFVESAMVKITITDGDKTLKHPGQECELQAEYELQLRQGKTRYDVTVLIDKGDGDSKYKVEIKYKRNGKAVLSGNLDVAPKKSGSLSKGKQKISVLVDPNGTVDGRDKIDGPDGDDPLDGAPGKKK